MTQPADEDVVAKIIGPPIFTALGTLIPWVAAGSTDVESALLTLLSILGGICGLALSLIYRRYLGVLGAGAEPEGSLERTAYGALRESLGEGGPAARLYARWLTGFLDAVERFFGDAGMADRPLFTHAFGLRTPAPLWTVPAFDSCLFLSWIYPILAIFLIWAVSGHVGLAEAALHLKTEIIAWQRVLAVALVAASIFAYWRAGQSLRRRQPVRYGWYAVVAATAAFCGISFIAGAIPGLMIVFACCANSYFISYSQITRNMSAGIGISSIYISYLIAVLYIDWNFFSHNFLDGILKFIFFIISFSLFLFLSDKIFRQECGNSFLLILLFAMIALCLGTPYVLSTSDNWEQFGPIILFVVLLSLINAPFDWASLGLTRALLRRGLELAAWWPSFLALVDAVLAAIIVAVLAIAMVIGVQAFNQLAVHGGGVPVLPLDALFDGIEANPTAPEYWWVYALLVTTLIPSLINLGIGGASLMRGLPGLPTLLLRYMPVGMTVPSFDRTWIAVVLALQVIGGGILGILAQALIFWAVIGYVMPWFGTSLLDMARDVAAFDLPSRLWQIFAGQP